MRWFRFEKLIRGKIVDNIIKAGEKVIYRVLPKDEFIHALRIKIAEEAAELPNTSSNDRMLEELADIQEGIAAILEATGTSKEQFAAVQGKKNEKFGDFKGRFFVTKVGVHDDSPWIKHYLEDPMRYPEIK